MIANLSQIGRQAAFGNAAQSRRLQLVNVPRRRDMMFRVGEDDQAALQNTFGESIAAPAPNGNFSALGKIGNAQPLPSQPTVAPRAVAARDGAANATKHPLSGIGNAQPFDNRRIMSGDDGTGAAQLPVNPSRTNLMSELAPQPIPNAELQSALLPQNASMLTSIGNAPPSRAAYDAALEQRRTLSDNPADYDKKKDSTWKNVGKMALYGLGNAGGGGLGGLVGGLIGGAIRGAVDPYADEKLISMPQARAAADENVKREKDAYETAVEGLLKTNQAQWIGQRPELEQDKLRSREEIAEANRNQRGEQFQQRMGLAERQLKLREGNFKRFEDYSGGQWKVFPDGRVEPFNDPTTGKQFENPYKQPIQIETASGRKFTLPQSKAAELSIQQDIAKATADFANAKSRYEQTNDNNAFQAAIDAQQTIFDSAGTFLNEVELELSAIDSTITALKGTADLPGASRDETFGESSKSLRQKIKQAEAERDDLLKKKNDYLKQQRNAESEMTKLRGRIVNTAPPQKRTPAFKVNPRKFNDADIERVLRQ